MKSRLEDFYMMTEDKDARVRAPPVRKKKADAAAKAKAAPERAESGHDVALDVQRLGGREGTWR